MLISYKTTLIGISMIMFGQIPGHCCLAKLKHKMNYYTGKCGPIQHDHLLLQSQQGRESPSRRSLARLCNIITEVLSCHYCHILLLNKKSPVLSIHGDEDHTAAWILGRRDPGGHVKVILLLSTLWLLWFTSFPHSKCIHLLPTFSEVSFHYIICSKSGISSFKSVPCVNIVL